MKTILIYSGGLDSTVLLYWLKNAMQDEVKALSIDYGQRHHKELYSAARICQALGVPHKEVNMASIGRDLLFGSSQTSDDIGVPYGHYTDESMKVTVVPNRNMIMLSLAIGWAIAERFDRVCYAAHKGDHTIYPDCRPEFYRALGQAAEICDFKPIGLAAPFITLGKDEIVEMGSKLNVPFAETWSCYEGQADHCGRCGTCVERREAFKLAGVPDLTIYVA